MNNQKINVSLVSPLPPPYGGIAHWTSMIMNYSASQSEVNINIVNTAPRWRRLDDIDIWKRVIGGGLQLIRDIFYFIDQLRSHPDVVHLTTSGQLAIIRDLVIIRISHLFRVPVVYHIRFGRIPEIADELTSEWKLMKKALCKADVVIAIDAATEKAIQSCLPAANVLKVPNCVDVSSLPSPEVNQSKQKIAMFLGWVIPAKGIEELLSAWSEIKPADWKLIIVGPGSLEYQKQLVAKYQPINAEFVGGKSHNEAMKLMAECDLFVFPSHTEGFPNVIAESMALGRAILAANVGAIPEMLSEECGILVEPKNVSDLKNVLQQMMSDDDLRYKLGNAARKRALSEYSLDSVFTRYVGIWTEISKLYNQDKN